MKKLLVLMLAVLTAVTSPEQFKMNSICPRQAGCVFTWTFCPAWKLCRNGRANNLLKPRCRTAPWFFMPALYEGQAGCSQGIQTPDKPLV